MNGVPECHECGTKILYGEPYHMKIDGRAVSWCHECADTWAWATWPQEFGPCPYYRNNSGRDVVSAGHKSVDERLGDLVRRLMSDQDGEIVSTVLAIRRVMKTAGLDFHVLADRVQKPNGNGLSEAEMRRIFDEGVEVGLQKAEEERRRPNYFRDVGDAEYWHEIASYCQQNPKRRFLYEREPDFLEDMVEQTADGDAPSEAQQVWLLKIYRRLGGKKL